MTLDLTKGMPEFRCDGEAGHCPHVFAPMLFRIPDAAKQIVRAGWAVRREGEVWRHYCGQCQLRPAGDEMADQLRVLICCDMPSRQPAEKAIEDWKAANRASDA